MRAHHGHVAGMIVGAILLLIGAFMLLIDDDEVDRLSIRRAVARTDISAVVEEADTTEDALARLETGEYDCVLLDYNLPGTDGLSLLNGLRASAPEIPVIMLTGQRDDAVAA